MSTLHTVSLVEEAESLPAVFRPVPIRALIELNNRSLIGALTNGTKLVICRFEPGASLHHAIIYTYPGGKYLSTKLTSWVDFPPSPLTPMNFLQVSEPFVRTSSCLVNCSRWARFFSDSPATLVTRLTGMELTDIGESILYSGVMSLDSMTSIAISSTNLFNATYSCAQPSKLRVLKLREYF
jgi:hypothetical protein